MHFTDPPENCSDCEISAVARVARHHHVPRVEHLLCEVGHGGRPVLGRPTRVQRPEPGHEEVEAGEGNLQQNSE